MDCSVYKAKKQITINNNIGNKQPLAEAAFLLVSKFSLEPSGWGNSSPHSGQQSQRFRIFLPQ